jgi:Outer membrane lipoprotein virB7
MNHGFTPTTFEWRAVLACVPIVYFEFLLKREFPFPAWRPCTFLHFGVVFVTLGLLGGCANSPLAVATGPLFPLNPGYWQPTPQDLAAPPRATQN